MPPHADHASPPAAGQTPEQRKPFSYFDKGSMATVSRFSAVMQVPLPGTKRKFETEGYFAWLGWLALHLVYLVGFRNRLNTFINWFFAFSTRGRSQLAVTEQQVYARSALQELSYLERLRIAQAKESGDPAQIVKAIDDALENRPTPPNI